MERAVTPASQIPFSPANTGMPAGITTFLTVSIPEAIVLSVGM